MRPPIPALSLLLLALAACDGDTSILCGAPPPASLGASAGVEAAGGPRRLSQVGPAAVRVTVRDSVSGQNLAQGATGAFVTGTFADSLRHDQPLSLTAYGPAGRYALVVNHPGYATWGRDGVRVRAGECGPETTEVTARLRPVDGP